MTTNATCPHKLTLSLRPSKLTAAASLSLPRRHSLVDETLPARQQSQVQVEAELGQIIGPLPGDARRHRAAGRGQTGIVTQ